MTAPRHPFEGLSIGWLLDQQAAVRGDQVFLVFEPFDGPAVTLTYREFRDTARQVARGLLARGLRRGDFVIIHLDNCPEFLLAWCGCALAGMVAVTTNTASAAPELAYYIEKSGARAAITQPAHLGVVSDAGAALDWIAVTETDSGIAPLSRPAKKERFADLMREDGPDLPEVRDMDNMSVQFTSGTTSRPKGVVWTHANALWAARVSATHEGLTSADVHHCVMPLYHTNALSYSWLATLWAGGTFVLQPRFSASRFWDVALRNRCSWSSIVAFCYNALAKDEIPAHHFRHWGIAFSNQVVEQRFGITPVSWYGMTETLTHAVVSTPHLPTPYGAIGRAAPEYGIHILDDDGSRVGEGGIGGLRIAGVPGVSLFKEYLNDPDATAKAYDENGLFDTGDQIAVLDGGWLKFADRKKDMMKTGGENVASSEVEAVILSIDGIAECAVVGKPDEMRGEVPVAFVTVAAPLAGRSRAEVASVVEAACAERLARFKVPKEVRVVEDFPRANIGKIAKAKLRDLL